MTRITSLSINGPTYGIGHASRQHALLETAKFEGWEIGELVINELDPLLPQLDRLWEIAKDSTCLVIDLDPRFVRDSYSELNGYLGDGRLRRAHKVVFDVEANFPIREMLNQVQCALAIFPYGAIGASVRGRELSGFGYSIFSKGLQDVRITKSYASSEEQNVLISCGGSDPENISLHYLETMGHFSGSKLHIKVVVGKFFSNEQIGLLLSLASKISHEVEILYSPPTLEEALKFADLGFVTGGLTRNESMFSGVCTVVTDINEEQHESTKLFASKDAVVSLGIQNSKKASQGEADPRELIMSILDDRNRQKSLIKNAKVCMPGNGALQVLVEIGEVCLKRV